MGLVRHGKFWWLDIRIKGKRIRRSLRTENRNEALARYAPLREKLLEKHLGEKVKFSDFCGQYLDWAWSSKPKIALKEQQRLNRIQGFFGKLGIVYLDDITPYHIEKLKADLQARGLKKSTINGWLQILRGMFYRAIDWEVYTKPNPLKKVRFLKPQSAVQGLSKEGMARVLEAAKTISESPLSQLQKIFYDLVVFGLNTGMRRSEVLNLTWKSVKDDSVEIIGKGEKKRSVPLNSMAKEIILKQPRREKFVFDVENRNNASLLHNTTRRLEKIAGVKFHYHLLRHAFTTSLVERGVDFVTIGAILGHSAISMSLIYSHTDKEKMKSAVDLLGRNLGHPER